MSSKVSEKNLYDLSGNGFVLRVLEKLNVRISRWQIALGILCITWLPLAVLTVVDGTFYSGVALPFIKDYSRQGRLLLGVPLLVLIYQVIYSRIPLVLEYVAEVLMLPADKKRFINGALRSAKSSNNAVWVQAAILILVAGVALSPVGGARLFESRGEPSTWVGAYGGGLGGVSRAGRWMQLVSIPVFQFLLIRWLWRYIVWVVLVYRISRFNLKLRPTHPDGAGGLGVVAFAQRNFNMFFFVCGIVIASNMVSGFVAQSVSFEVIKVEIFGFILLSLVIIFFPLFFFSRKLIITKYTGHLSLGKAGLYASERFEDEWVKEMTEKKAKAEDTIDPSFQTDYTSIYRYLQDLSIVPVRFWDIILVSVVLFVPFIPLFFMRFSVIELLEKIMGLLV